MSIRDVYYHLKEKSRPYCTVQYSHAETCCPKNRIMRRFNCEKFLFKGTFRPGTLHAGTHRPNLTNERMLYS
jgi:hypothetical protein